MYSLISQGIHTLWGIKQVPGGENAIFEQNASMSLARWHWWLLHYFKQACLQLIFPSNWSSVRHAFASCGFVSGFVRVCQLGFFVQLPINDLLTSL